MSLRDYFAAKAINGLLAHNSPGEGVEFEPLDPQKEAHTSHLAKCAYLLADAMLAARRHDSTGDGK